MNGDVGAVLGEAGTTPAGWFRTFFWGTDPRRCRHWRQFHVVVVRRPLVGGRRRVLVTGLADQVGRGSVRSGLSGLSGVASGGVLSSSRLGRVVSVGVLSGLCPSVAGAGPSACGVGPSPPRAAGAGPSVRIGAVGGDAAGTCGGFRGTCRGRGFRPGRRGGVRTGGRALRAAARNRPAQAGPHRAEGRTHRVAAKASRSAAARWRRDRAARASTTVRWRATTRPASRSGNWR